MSSTKGRAKQFLTKLFDLNKDDNPAPPSRPSQDLVQSFDALNLAGNPNYNYSNPTFIGGFSLPNHAPLPHPPSMPVPAPYQAQQSLTMQYALQPTQEQTLAPPLPQRPHSTSPLSAPAHNLSPPPSPAKPVVAPTKPKRLRASSDPSTSSDQQALLQTQCAGVTKAGKRCTRQVKSGPALSQVLAEDDEDGSPTQPIERFCFQHAKELLEPSGYYARKNGEWVDFEDWIPGYLQPDTQVALRVEMEKSRSQSDVPGYIYTFEIREPKNLSAVKLKVGRAVNLVKRIDQWGKQCGSKEQVLRGWYPGTVEPDEDGGDGSLMKGRVKAGEKGAWCHRLERLIHLELADLAATCVYLDSAWPKPSVSSANLSSSSVSTPKKGATNNNSTPCSDCGALHKEIFEFKRVEKGRNRGKEWELVVKPVIERWGMFVALYV